MGAVFAFRPDPVDKGQEVITRLAWIAVAEQALDRGARGGRELGDLAEQVVQLVIDGGSGGAHGGIILRIALADQIGSNSVERLPNSTPILTPNVGEFY